MEIVRIKMKDLAANRGQVPGLPANPRSWTKGDVERIAKSLKDTPELFEARPLLVYPYGGQYVILGGNLRHAGAQRNHEKDVPCIVFPEDTPPAKLKEIVVKDNGAFGSWDYDALGNEWDDLPLPEWGVPAWDASEMHLTTEGREGAEGYQDFVEKFQPKLTTDDCYTPEPIYEAVKAWVSRRLLDLDGVQIVRPFYPGGDYQNADYPDGCLVLDNPPFSIYAEIVRFYLERGIRFFLFGPALTLKVRGADATYIVERASVTYENGAVVSTSFVTNLCTEERVIISPDLYRSIKEADAHQAADLAKYAFPDELKTIATLGKIAKGEEEVVLLKTECEEVQDIEALKEAGKSLYGGGYLLSREAAAMIAAREAAAREAAAMIAAREAAARKAAAMIAAREAAARKAAIPVALSETEQEIVERLSNYGKQPAEHNS
ncbi:MAG: ParB-like nuclease domain-containing protein [Clostridia bacterium]|nr:ParB-like nuclease domain-containing protein [Clostridia bacterium]